MRTTGLRAVAGLVQRARKSLARVGLRAAPVTGGGTGTLDLLGEAGAHTEAQPGSYVLMDATYRRLRLPFEPALWVVGRVVSYRKGERAVLDAGLKSISVEYGLPRPARSGMTVLGLSDEHTKVGLRPGARLEIGEPVLLQPSHIDPTVNLHPRLFVVNDRSPEPWDVDGRRS